MATQPLEVTRAQVLGYRRSVGGLDERWPTGARALRMAAWAGLQDSAPRAALLSVSARVQAAAADSWQHPSLVQLWGPRSNAYVVADADRGVFTLGRMPDDAATVGRAEQLADRVEGFLDGRRMTYDEVGRALGMHPNGLREAAPTGRVALRWDGARKPTIWAVPRPVLDRRDARLELARRYLRVFGPATARGFAQWAGVGPAHARATFEALAGSLTAVRTDVGEAWILSEDEADVRRADRRHGAAARLLPGGDAFLLLWGADRGLLVPDPTQQRELWPPRVWPGAVLVDGDVAGTWRRVGPQITVTVRRRLAPAARAAVEDEAHALPLPDLQAPVVVRWAA